MVHVYEFEVYESEGFQIVEPFDLEGGTEGYDVRDAAMMAVDWLKITVEHCAMHHIELPEPTFGNRPRHGGTVMLVAVDAGVETVPRVTPAEAARALGVTPGRVSQLMASGRLEHFEYGGRTWVSRYSLEARLAERPKPGRPKKKRVPSSVDNSADGPAADSEPTQAQA